jgi:signal recognition particle receptor subunit beta
MSYKILFVGPIGAGKTTAIAAVSDIPPITTEAKNNDQHLCAKPTTTVAMDYGEIRLSDEETTVLYGIPGQERFDFMWPVLASGAMGAVLLLDHSRTNTYDDLALYLKGFDALAKQGSVVVGVGRMPGSDRQGVARYREVLARHFLNLPIFAVDVRQRADVLLLLEALIVNHEARNTEDAN